MTELAVVCPYCGACFDCYVAHCAECGNAIQDPSWDDDGDEDEPDFI